MLRNAFAKALLGCTLSLMALGCMAQTYRCSNGTVRYYSDKPCPSSGGGGGLTSMGPSSTHTAPPTYQTPIPSVSKAPDHIKYLHGACASLNDAIRTAPARGVSWQVINDLRGEYERKCREDDQNARQMLSQDQSSEREQRTAALSAPAEERKQAQMKAQQCDAIRDAVQTRRRRMDTMTPSELNALRDTEASFNTRCLGR
jgi:hypothetical protein